MYIQANNNPRPQIECQTVISRPRTNDCLLLRRGLFRSNGTNTVKQKVCILPHDIGDTGDGDFVVVHQNPLGIKLAQQRPITRNHCTHLITTKTSVGEIVTRIHSSLVNDDGG